MAKSKKSTSKDMAKSTGGLPAGIVADDQVPEHVSSGKGLGSEEVTSEDIVIPRLELVQALSPCRKKNDPAYIEGAEEGLLFNTLTRELYGESVVFVPVMFHKQWLVWKDRKAGGGFRGAFNSPEEARVRVEECEAADDGPVESVDTDQHVILIMREDGRMEEAALSMARSKKKISRQLNSIVRMRGGDRFSSAYRLSTYEDSNDQGDSFWNYRATPVGYVSDEVYAAAKSMYDSMVADPNRYSVDSGETDTVGSQEDNSEY